MAIRPTPGRSLVSARALRDIVRTATLGSYGVTGFAGGAVGRALERVGLGRAGLTVRTGDPIEVELDLTVALGVPVAEVARQVDSAVRYAIRRALDRDVGRILIHIDGLEVPAGGPVPAQTPARRPARGRAARRRPAASPTDRAGSGTDVA